MTPSLGLTNLLQKLTELREMFYLPDYWFIMKAYNPGIARWKRYIGYRVRKGQEASMSLRARHSPHISTCSPTWKLSVHLFLGFYGAFITQS